MGVETTEALKTWRFFEEKKAISKSLYRIVKSVLTDKSIVPRVGNSFPRIRQYVLSDCNSFPRLSQSVISDCNSLPRLDVGC